MTRLDNRSLYNKKDLQMMDPLFTISLGCPIPHVSSPPLSQESPLPTKDLGEALPRWVSPPEPI